MCAVSLVSAGLLQFGHCRPMFHPVGDAPTVAKGQLRSRRGRKGKWEATETAEVMDPVASRAWQKIDRMFLSRTLLDRGGARFDSLQTWEMLRFFANLSLQGGC